MEKPTLLIDHPPERRSSSSSSSTTQWGSHEKRGAWPGLLQLWAFYVALTLSTVGTSVAQSVGCFGTNTTHPSEVAALLGVFRGFQGTDNVSLPGWGGLGDPCGQSGTGGFGSVGAGWAGVVCQKVGGNCTTTVSGLRLTNLNIKGTLSPNIQALRNLTTLTIAGNPELTGPIPDGLVNLTQLVMLDLHGNAFNDSIPTLGDLRRLQLLDVSGNQIAGPIPSWLGNLTQIQKLDLSNNLLSGPLPVSSSNNSIGLNNLTYAVQMSFSNNSLSGRLDGLSTLHNLRTLNGSNNHFNGTFPTMLLQVQNMPQLVVLDLSGNEIIGALPDVSLPALQEIYLANNKLNGNLSSGFLNSSTLQFLNLDGNNITGTLNLQMLQSSSTLQLISLTNNNITDVLFTNNSALQSASNVAPWNRLFLGGNPYCNDPQTNLQLQICRSDENQVLTRKVSSSKKTNNNRFIILITAAAAGVVVVLATIISLLFMRRLTYRLHDLHATQQGFAKLEKVQPNLYSYSELKVATEDFSSDRRVGQGGFGVVYKGVLSNDALVAVKKLSNSDQALAEFLDEVVTLSNVRHQNLVKLQGCCIKGDQRLLVYEYVENKNLAEALWDCPSDGGQQMDWDARFNIILGIAHGLAYLHEEVKPPIIHRDVKAANILLDRDMNPKIGDFGLALLFPTLDEDRTQISANIAGTKGYLSPEYASLGQVSEKADVFSFGILVLEVMSGRKNVNLRLPAEQRYILEWAWKLYEADALSDFIDAKLTDRSKEEDMKQVIKIGLACVQYSAERRPSMSHVVSVLLGNKALDTINRDSELSKGEIESMFATIQTSSLTPVDEDSPLLVGLPTASASGAFIELGKLKPR